MIWWTYLCSKVSKSRLGKYLFQSLFNAFASCNDFLTTNYSGELIHRVLRLYLRFGGSIPGAQRRWCWAAWWCSPRVSWPVHPTRLARLPSCQQMWFNLESESRHIQRCPSNVLQKCSIPSPHHWLRDVSVVINVVVPEWFFWNRIRIPRFSWLRIRIRILPEVFLIFLKNFTFVFPS